MDLQPHIFREYDIRGIVGEDLDEDVVEAVGRGYGSVLRGRIRDRTPRVAVGEDNRPSSPGLADALIRGLNGAGIEVVHLGTVPTPVVYWAEHVLDTDGGIQITGSHNPAEYNGIKMTLLKRPFFGSDLQDLRRRIERDDFVSGSAARTEREVLDRYVEDVAGRFDPPRPVKVVVDCGNGTASVVAQKLLEAVGAEVVPLYCESDGTFPNHHPDPTVDENLEDLIAEVRSSGAEAGISFDGDGDRLGVVDENGEVVRADLLLLLFGLDLLDREGPRQKMVFDVKCSQAVPEVFGDEGGQPIMWKTGHSLMKEKMRTSKAPLGGELSGHLFFADDYYGFDDALYAACRLVDLLARKGVEDEDDEDQEPETLSEMMADFPEYVSTPEIRIEVDEASKKELVADALVHFREDYPVIEVDGARILFGDGWGLLRSSNTQPVLVARFEAPNTERLEEMKEEVLGWLREKGVDVDAVS